MSKSIIVAVGIVQSPQGDILIAKRPDHVHQGGFWEFPGGKVEAGETVAQALSRELSEELGIDVTDSEPVMTIDHDYGDKQVSLRVCRVTAFSGEAQGREGQPLCWVAPADLKHYTFPDANKVIVERLMRET